MSATKPHYLLFCDGSLPSSIANEAEGLGRWRFVLEHIETGTKIEAADNEPTDHLDRTSLLAVMRGLEALDQPSRVTLITTSRYVARGLQYGLSEWRENDYCWEHFGSVQPIRNADLWRRVDVALQFHQVQCRWMAQDTPNSHQELETKLATAPTETVERECAVTSPTPRECAVTSPVPIEKSATQSEKSIKANRSNPCVSKPIASKPTKNRQHLEKPKPLQEKESNPVAALSQNAPTVTETPLVLATLENKTSVRILVPVRWAWGLILTLDSFLISCLHCLFLIDPRREHYRSRKS